MVKISKSPEEKGYYQQQQAIAGCMVHGPHGVSPAMVPQPFGFAPPFFGFQHQGEYSSQKSASGEK
jgi:hypothetical protein